MTRGIMGPAGMSEEAQAYWSGIFEKVCATEAWIKDYVEPGGLTAAFMNYIDYTAYYEKNEKSLIEKVAVLDD